MPTPENPIITEHQEEFIVPEKLQNLGVNSTQAQPKDVQDDKGNPLISTQSTTGAKIQIPSDRTTLLQKAKGSIKDAATWLARFFLRQLSIKEKNANTDTTN